MKKKILICLAFLLGILVFLLVVNFVWLITGKPKVSTNYVAQLNEMIRPSDAKEEENALICYQRAFNLYFEPNEGVDEIIRRAGRPAAADYQRFLDLRAGEQAALRAWLKVNEPAWEEFEAGSRRRYFWVEHDESQQMMEIIVPALSKFRGLGRMGIWRAKLLQEEGEIQEAINKYLAVLRVGRHLQGMQLVVEHMVGISLGKTAYTEIMNLIGTLPLPAEELERLQKKMTEVYKGEYPRVSIEGERYFFLDIIQRSFTDDGPGGGHLIMFNPDLSLLSSSGASKLSVVDFVLHAGKDNTTAQVNMLYDQLDKMAALRPYEAHYSKMKTAEQMLSDLPRRRYKLIHILFPALERVYSWNYQNKAYYEAAVTVLALQRWKPAKGQYPEKLEELEAGGYLMRLPMDPYGPGVMPYQRRGEGLILYSRGADFDDDGGLQNSDDLWGEEVAGGDRVFWPIRKN